jgi:hypothetical protein
MQNVNSVIEESIAFLMPSSRIGIFWSNWNSTSRSHPRDRPRSDQTAFYNIIRNAFQAMRTGGILRIRSGGDETHEFVSFSDTGGGISPENISRVFEPTSQQSRADPDWVF